MAQMFKSADGAALRFFEVPVKNNHASDVHGKALFDSVLMVEVMSPGSKESCPHFECERTFCDAAIELNRDLAKPRRSRYYEKYAAQIEAYKAGTASLELTGTPISQWPQADVALTETLAHAKVHTVEALAAIPDSQLNGVGPGMRKWRDKAAAWLASVASGGDTSKLVSELDAVRTDLERVTAERDAALSELAAVKAANTGAAISAKPAKAPAAPATPAAPAAPAAPPLGNIV